LAVLCAGCLCSIWHNNNNIDNNNNNNMNNNANEGKCNVNVSAW